MQLQSSQKASKIFTSGQRSQKISQKEIKVNFKMKLKKRLKPQSLQIILKMSSAQCNAGFSRSLSIHKPRNEHKQTKFVVIVGCRFDSDFQRMR